MDTEGSFGVHSYLKKSDGDGMNQKIGLVYLNRRAEGSVPVERFVRSYKAFDSGVYHEFITIYKGFTDKEMDAAKPFFKDIEHRHIAVDDEMTDIDSYLIAVDSFPDVDIFCFLNTFSEIACENWLLFLYNALSNDSVGIAGATSSYESIVDSNRLISKVVWLCQNNYLKYDRDLHLQYKTILATHASRWLRKNLFQQLISRIRGRRHDYGYLAAYDAAFEEFWKILIADDGVYAFLRDSPSFPNPSIRTNGFMIRRKQLLPFFGRSRGMTKNMSYLFESGNNGLTSHILKQGLRAITVNCAGDMFDVEEWPQSQTFRLGQQQGLLIRDNQTRNFDRLSSAEREVLAYMTWGRLAKYSSGRVFTFGISFDAK